MFGGAHWTGIVIIAVLALILFGGRGKISSFMGDIAKGVTAFRKGLKEDDAEASPAGEAKTEALGAGEDAKAESRREDERTGS